MPYQLITPDSYLRKAQTLRLHKLEGKLQDLYSVSIMKIYF